MMTKTITTTSKTLETITTETTERLQQNEKYQHYQHPYSPSNAAVLQEIGMEGILKLSVLQPIWESLRCLWDVGENLGSGQH